MAEFTIKVRYADVREITIEADTIEEAEEKYKAGDWDSEHTLDYYALEELSALAPSPSQTPSQHSDKE